MADQALSPRGPSTLSTSFTRRGPSPGSNLSGEFENFHRGTLRRFNRQRKLLFDMLGQFRGIFGQRGRRLQTEFRDQAPQIVAAVDRNTDPTVNFWRRVPSAARRVRQSVRDGCSGDASEIPDTG